MTVCGRDIKLESLQPSIGTAVHGLDLAADLDDPEHGAEPVAFARRFGERGHMSNSPHAPNPQQVPREEARTLPQMKMQTGRPEYTCRVRSEPSSIAIWDNRAVLHSASGDFWPHKRLMERLTMLDFEESRRTPYYAPPAAAAA